MSAAGAPPAPPAIPPPAVPPAATPACGFIGWGPESAAMLEALRRRFPDVEARATALAPAAGGSAGRAASGAATGTARAAAVPRAPLARSVPTLEGLFQAAELVFAEGGQKALEAHLAMIRLAISDRHVLVLLGGGWALEPLLEQLKERKLARCMLLPTRPGTLGTLAFYASPYFSPQELADFRALFAHLELVVELREERHFDVLQGLADFAPAAFYTVIEAMADGVVMMGFSRAAALQILASLLLGAAERVLEGQASAAVLRERALEVDVAAAGLIELESAGIRGALMRAIQRTVRKPRTAILPSPEEPD
jgi:pyrroline-5-carboxylate reductase